MRYITDRKRAVGLGAAHTGTEHHWYMIVSSVALVGLIPVFVFLVGSSLGNPHDEVVATFSRPFPAVVVLLTLWVGWMHFRRGAQTMIEDYARGLTRKILLIAMMCISYTAMAAGLYAIVRIAI
ncbi:succinate dehydrogenase / fumarate reductase membrane anchor subunit [Rhodovulum bhavnagarense]|uniref:Succinate dehydrogenase hydrophobic membrane anchor subunit n=1 Tax=Rhodovulum bhavnagarense TaxID=992286 RepID=A0A4R2RHH3_9RHOB|nr:succinate dehydrogenase, hydrophobic membrane anchor protein [Rhodovulum bhavnagarense]TCP62234.1 succinate dehydrogenase / fumarate reductase membrane anchor subunit [Rhodovulum bhavnagarense]